MNAYFVKSDQMRPIDATQRRSSSFYATFRVNYGKEICMRFSDKLQKNISAQTQTRFHSEATLLSMLDWLTRFFFS